MSVIILEALPGAITAALDSGLIACRIVLVAGRGDAVRLRVIRKCRLPRRAELASQPESMCPAPSARSGSGLSQSAPIPDMPTSSATAILFSILIYKFDPVSNYSAIVEREDGDWLNGLAIAY